MLPIWLKEHSITKYFTSKVNYFLLTLAFIAIFLFLVRKNVESPLHLSGRRILNALSRGFKLPHFWIAMLLLFVMVRVPNHRLLCRLNFYKHVHRWTNLSAQTGRFIRICAETGLLNISILNLSLLYFLCDVIGLLL